MFRFNIFDLDVFRGPPDRAKSPSPDVTSPLESSSVEDAWKVAGDVTGDEFCDPVSRYRLLRGKRKAYDKTR